MKHFYSIKKTFGLFLVSFFTLLGVQAQTIEVTSVTPSPVCSGTEATVNFSTTSGNGGNRFDQTTRFTLSLSANGVTTPIKTFTLPAANFPNNGAGKTFTHTTSLPVPFTQAEGNYSVIITSENPLQVATTPFSGFVVGKPAAPTATSNQLGTYGSSVVTASVAAGNTINWYDASTGGNLLFTGTSYTLPVTTDVGLKTYYAETASINNVGCASATRTPVSINVTPKSIIGGFTAADKIFDGNTKATVVSRDLFGVVAGDEEGVELLGTNATFDSPLVGERVVTLNDGSLSGARAFNYNLSSVNTTTARINEVPLPVTLVSFEADLTSDAVALTWSTATEVDNDYFLVERSTNAVDYTSVGTVDGNGNSNVVLNYSFSDATAPKGTVYYRLKQVDFDGKFEYTKVISVKSTGFAQAQAKVSTYPNPTTGEVTLSTNLAGAATITLFHSSGRVVLTQQIESNGQALVLDISAQVSGVYYLQVQTATGKATTRVIKQ